MVGPRFRAPRHAVIAVPQGADLLATALAADVVEPAEEVAQQADEVLGRLVGAHLGEADDVGEEDADVLHLAHVEGPEGHGGCAAHVRKLLRPVLVVRVSLGVSRAHDLLGYLRGHEGVDHVLLELLLNLEVLSRLDGLAYLQEGASLTNLGDHEEVDSQKVDSGMEEESSHDEAPIGHGRQDRREGLEHDGVRDADDHAEVQGHGDEGVQQGDNLDAPDEDPDQGHVRVRREDVVEEAGRAEDQREENGHQQLLLSINFRARQQEDAQSHQKQD